jgi:MFS family permease
MPVLGLRPNTVLALLSLASFFCCVPMAMPAGHLVAFCGDLGIPPARGAAMLSLLLGAAFVSRQFWGLVADRIGGLRTVLAASACQAAAQTGFLLTQDEIGLFTVSAAFGLGFSGIIPAYVLAVRELFPANEAGWRVPTLLFASMVGMAFGNWLAGALYDRFGSYAPAFAAGVAANLANLVVVGSLVALRRNARVRPALG